MTLYETQQAFIADAKFIGDYESLTKTELANGYCDAEESLWEAEAKNNEEDIFYFTRYRNAYYSALMLRYWYKIFEWKATSSSLETEPTTFVDWLTDALYVVFYYKSWRLKYKSITDHGHFRSWVLDENGEKILNPYYYKLDPNAPDKIINRCCLSIRGKEYQYYNKDKRRTLINTYSLDGMMEEAGDAATAKCDREVRADYSDGVKALVEAFLAQNKVIEALVIDGIANYDSFKSVRTTNSATKVIDGEEKEVKVKTVTSIFDKRKLIKHLSGLDSDFISDFCSEYSNPEKSEMIYSKLKGLNNSKLYKYMEKTLLELKTNPKLLSYLFQ